MKRKTSLIIATALILTSLAGCNEDKKEVKTLGNIGGSLVLEENASKQEKVDNVNVEHGPSSSQENIDINNSDTEKSDDNKIYDVDAELQELVINGTDDTEYFDIKGADIVYNGVTYQNLNKAMEALPHPYDNTTLINFIVKTYEPIGDTVKVDYYLGDENGYVEGWSMGLSDDLSMNWEGYGALQSKYGSNVRWVISLFDAKTYDNKSSLYGNKDYIVFLGAEGGSEVNMDDLAQIKPGN